MQKHRGRKPLEKYYLYVMDIAIDVIKDEGSIYIIATYRPNPELSTRYSTDFNVITSNVMDNNLYKYMNDTVRRNKDVIGLRVEELV